MTDNTISPVDRALSTPVSQIMSQSDAQIVASARRDALWVNVATDEQIVAEYRKAEAAGQKMFEQMGVFAVLAAVIELSRVIGYLQFSVMLPDTALTEPQADLQGRSRLDEIRSMLVRAADELDAACTTYQSVTGLPHPMAATTLQMIKRYRDALLSYNTTGHLKRFRQAVKGAAHDIQHLIGQIKRSGETPDDMKKHTIAVIAHKLHSQGYKYREIASKMIAMLNVVQWANDGLEPKMIDWLNTVDKDGKKLSREVSNAYKDGVIADVVFCDQVYKRYFVSLSHN